MAPWPLGLSTSKPASRVFACFIKPLARAPEPGALRPRPAASTSGNQTALRAESKPRGRGIEGTRRFRVTCVKFATLLDYLFAHPLAPRDFLRDAGVGRIRRVYFEIRSGVIIIEICFCIFVSILVPLQFRINLYVYDTACFLLNNNRGVTIRSGQLDLLEFSV